MATLGNVEQNRPANQAGTGYINLGQYINANQNNQLGQTVGSGIQAAGQAATGAVNQAGQQFQSAAQTEQQRLGQLSQDVTGAVSNVMGGGTVSASDASNVQSALSGQSQAPTGLANTTQLQQQSQSASNLGQAAGSQAGRYGLLQQFVGRGQNYNLGSQGLDEMLLGQTGQQQLAQAQTNTATLPGQTQLAINAAASQGQALKGQAQQLVANTQNQLGGAVNQYNQQMQQQLQNQQQQYMGALSGLSGMTNAPVVMSTDALNKLTAATQGQLQAGTNLYNVDPTQFVSMNTLYNTPQAAQTASDFQKVQNLSQLAGNSLAGTNAGQTLQQYLANPSAVGQLAANPYSVSNLNQLATALSSAQNNYQTTQTNLENQLNATTNTGIGPVNQGMAALQTAIGNAEAAAHHGYKPIDQLAPQYGTAAFNKLINDYWGSNAGRVNVDAKGKVVPTPLNALAAGYMYDLMQQGAIKNQISALPQQFDIFRVLSAPKESPRVVTG